MTKAERAAKKLIAHCEAREDCKGCAFVSGAFCSIAKITGEGVPLTWRGEAEASCKPQNSPADERKADEGIIGRVEELERQIGCINARLENHGEWLGNLQESCDDLGARMVNNAVWHKDVDVAQEKLEKRIDDLYNTKDRYSIQLDRLVNRIEALEEWRRG